MVSDSLVLGSSLCWGISTTERPLSSAEKLRSSHLEGVEKARDPRELRTFFFFAANTTALECKPTSHFLAAFNFSLSSSSVSFSPTHPPSPLSFPSPLSAPQWPSPTQSLEQCEWETACVTKAIKRTHAHIPTRGHTHTHTRKNTRKNTSMQVKIHECITNNIT